MTNTLTVVEQEFKNITMAGQPKPKLNLTNIRNLTSAPLGVYPVCHCNTKHNISIIISITTISIIITNLNL